jgi:hypothetical protein
MAVLTHVPLVPLPDPSALVVWGAAGERSAVVTREVAG